MGALHNGVRPCWDLFPDRRTLKRPPTALREHAKGVAVRAQGCEGERRKTRWIHGARARIRKLHQRSGCSATNPGLSTRPGSAECEGQDLNLGSTKHRILSPAPLTGLGYPRASWWEDERPEKVGRREAGLGLVVLRPAVVA